MAEPIKVVCSMEQCMYYQDIPGDRQFCYCSNDKKPHYMNQKPCPLYRMDWNKAGSTQEALKRRFGIGA